MTRASRAFARCLAIAVVLTALSKPSASAQFHTLTVNGVDYPLLRAAFGDCIAGNVFRRMGHLRGCHQSFYRRLSGDQQCCRQSCPDRPRRRLQF